MNKLDKPLPREMVNGSVNHLNKLLNQMITPFLLRDQLAISNVITGLKQERESNENLTARLQQLEARLIEKGIEV